MGEALIVGRGGGSSGGSGKLKTEIITSNTTWVVPKAKNQLFSVRIFGGGGAGGFSQFDGGGAGGGGGFMNNSMLNLAQGLSIAITIGAGGRINKINDYYIEGKTGGTTSFGTILYAAGGGGATGGRPGDGGSGGGGGNGWHGGNGYQFGGGAGLGFGFGGKWGGGGGYISSAVSLEQSMYYGGQPGGCLTNPSDPGKYMNTSNPGANVSGLAGNGGVIRYTANPTPIAAFKGSNGTNTIGNNNIFNGLDATKINIYNEDVCAGNLRGAGLGGSAFIVNRYGDNLLYSLSTSSAARIMTGGGGGFGGNGGSGGGGGGYGSNGGRIVNDGSYMDWRHIVGGGGGGYGGDGGNAGINYYSSGGGGGGYGKSGKGGDGDSNSSSINIGGFAAGGGGGQASINNIISGGNGICIIQYYE